MANNISTRKPATSKPKRQASRKRSSSKASRKNELVKPAQPLFRAYTSLAHRVKKIRTPHLPISLLARQARLAVTNKRVLVLTVCVVMLIVNIAASKKVRSEDLVLSTATTSATEKEPGIWCEVCRVENVSIPSIYFSDDKVAKMSFDVNTKTWPTPISGIATPKETVPNNVILFGHSKWSGRQSHFSRISMLKVGDEIVVTDQFGKQYHFEVTSLELVDRFNGDAIHPKQKLQLTMLTSARSNGEWLLPTSVDDATQDSVKDNQAYAIFIVTALPK